MGKGSGKRGFVKRKLPPKDTPVRDRLRAVAASRHASSENVGTVESATPPSSVIDTIGSWINGSAPSESPHNEIKPEDYNSIADVSNSPTPLSKKTKKKRRKSGNKSTDIGSSIPSSTLPESIDCSRQCTGSRSTSFQSMDGSVDLLSAKASHGRSTSKQSTDLAEKRDSVISRTWGGMNLEAAPTVMKQDLPEKTWRKLIRPSVWWPTRLYRWVRRIVFAVIQGFQGPRGSDFWLSLGLLLVCGYVACVALDFVIFGLIKGVKAQDLVEAANCSVVYVTIPGPIITVSLIAATPSDPARGTYYYSVINGTTEWLNSIAPPSRSSFTATRTPVLTTPSLSQPASGSTIEVPPSTSGSVVLPSLPPGIETTFTTTIPSGNTLTITTITLLSSMTLPTDPPNSPLPPSASPIADTPILQPQPYSSRDISSTRLGLSSGISTMTLYSSVPESTASAPSTQASELPSSVIQLPGPVISSVFATSPPLPVVSSISQLSLVSSTIFVITSIIPGGQTTILTSTSTTLISAGPPNLVSGSTPPLLSNMPTPATTTLPSGQTSLVTSMITSLDVSVSPTTSSAIIPANSNLLVTITSTVSDGQTIVVTLVSTSVLSVPSTSAPIVTSASLVTLTSTLPGGQTTASTSTVTTIISSISSLPLPLSPSASTIGSLLIPTSLTTATSSDGFTVSLPQPTPGNTSAGTPLTQISSRRSTIITATSFPVTFVSGSSSLSTQSIPPSLPSGVISSTALLSMSSVTMPGPAFSSSSILPSPPSRAVSATPGLPLSSVISSLSGISSPLLSPPGSSTLTSSAGMSSGGTSTPALIIPPATSQTLSNFTSVFLTSSFTVPVANPSTTSSTLPTLPSSAAFNATQGSSTNVVVSTPPATSSLATIPVLPGVSFSMNSSSSAAASTVSSGSLTSTIAIITPPFSTIVAFNTSTRSVTTPPAAPSSVLTNTTLSSSTSISTILSPTSTAVSLPVLLSSNLINSTTSTTSSSLSSSSTLSASLGSSPGLSAATGTPSVILSPTVQLTSTAPVNTVPVVVTSAPPAVSNGTSALQVRALMTRVVSYGNTSVVFVFPTPTIVTTVTYWTGTYPTVTGAEPSDLQTIPLTTRSIRQTPLSALPSFELFASTVSGFETVETPPSGQQASGNDDNITQEYKRLADVYTQSGLCIECRHWAKLRLHAHEFNFVGPCRCKWLTDLGIARSYYEEGRWHTM